MIVNFPDRIWAQLATIAEKRGVRIPELIVEAARATLTPQPQPQQPARPVPVRRQPLDWREVARLHGHGLNDRQIADAMGRHVATVQRARVAMGLPRQSEGKWKSKPPAVDWTDEAVAARIREGHELHRSVAHLAEEFGVSYDAMRVAYRHLGITPHRSKTNQKETAA